MSQYLADDNLNVYYTDTDSITTDRPLDNKHIGNNLGQFKLENEYKEAIFLAPKVYAGYTADGKYICKIKGFTDTVPFEELKTLLNVNNQLNLNHNKLFKSLANGTIFSKNNGYNYYLLCAKI